MAPARIPHGHLQGGHCHHGRAFVVVVAGTQHMAGHPLNVHHGVRQRDRENGLDQHRLNEFEQANGLAIALDAVGQGDFNQQARGRRAGA